MKDKMLTEVIRKYGFEHKITLMFARLCENGTSMARLTTIYKIIMKKQKGGKPFFYWLRAHGQGAQCFAWSMPIEKIFLKNFDLGVDFRLPIVYH